MPQVSSDAAKINKQTHVKNKGKKEVIMPECNRVIEEGLSGSC